MRKFIGFLIVLFYLVGTARSAHVQATIEVGDNVNLRFGILGQFWADAVNDTGTNDAARATPSSICRSRSAP